MQEPLAYLLTWTCYGSWLHGDERGSVERGQNVVGEAFVPEDVSRVQFELRAMKGGAVRLDPRGRTVVRRAIEEHARFRGWQVLALNVRSNHVHVVVEHAEWGPERMMASFKARATRALRCAGLVGAEARVWTRHGSTRYVWNGPSINAAVDYVNEGQDVPR